jgi:hypothetical protein
MMLHSKLTVMCHMRWVLLFWRELKFLIPNEDAIDPIHVDWVACQYMLEAGIKIKLIIARVSAHQVMYPGVKFALNRPL